MNETGDDRTRDRGVNGPILVIDDDEDVVVLVEAVLSRDGHRVIGVTDAREGLAIAEASPPSLVLLDLMLPHMDGETFLDVLHARLRGATPPIVLVTASIERREVARRVGAAASLEKPFDPDDLRDVVARFAQR